MGLIIKHDVFIDFVGQQIRRGVTQYVGQSLQVSA